MKLDNPLKGDELHLKVNLSEEDKNKANQLLGIPKEIAKKMVDIYNYMVEKNAQKIVMSFESGMKISFELDDNEWLKMKGEK